MTGGFEKPLLNCYDEKARGSTATGTKPPRSPRPTGHDAGGAERAPGAPTREAGQHRHGEAGRRGFWGAR
jgi:hypothetical protein